MLLRTTLTAAATALAVTLPATAQQNQGRYSGSSAQPQSAQYGNDSSNQQQDWYDNNQRQGWQQTQNRGWQQRDRQGWNQSQQDWSQRDRSMSQDWQQRQQQDRGQQGWNRGSWQSDSQNSQRSQRGQSGQSDQSQGINFNGQLQSYRTIQLQGENEPHVLAKVQRQDGRTVIADLGPVSNLQQQQLRLRRGQQMQGSGRSGRINGQPIIVLDSYVGDGQFVVIDPGTRARNASNSDSTNSNRQPMRQRMRQQMQQDRDQQQFHEQVASRSQQYAFPRQGMGMNQATQQQLAILVQGTIEDLRQVDLDKESATHRVADIQTRGGRSVMVDLGTGEELQDVKLKTNEWVMVLGQPGEINGEPAVIAEALADIVTINRQNDQSQQQSKDSASSSKKTSTSTSASKKDADKTSTSSHASDEKDDD